MPPFCCSNCSTIKSHGFAPCVVVEALFGLPIGAAELPLSTPPRIASRIPMGPPARLEGRVYVAPFFSTIVGSRSHQVAFAAVSFRADRRTNRRPFTANRGSRHVQRSHGIGHRID